MIALRQEVWILDVGVGSGRTAWILRLLTECYTGIDYAPEMVRACRESYPGIDVRQGDARDLSAFDEATFKLVVFSFNGLDSLSNDDRLLALSEFHRVLVPEGLLLYSTLNMAGPLFGLRPWQFQELRRSAWQLRSARGLPLLQRLSAPISSSWRSYRNWRISTSLTEVRKGWAMSAIRSHEYGLVVHYSLPSTERTNLSSLGFEIAEVVDADGMAATDSSTVSSWFYVLARKH